MNARFWSKVEKTSECWVWKASVGTHGYGQFKHNGKPTHAHRVSFELTHGAIQAGAYVLHRCDNRLCVNPEHLFLGTHAENMHDMKQKGRAGYLRRAGEQNPSAKLTNTQAAEIRAMCSSGATQREAAAQFGVSQRAVWNIVNGVGYVA